MVFGYRAFDARCESGGYYWVWGLLGLVGVPPRPWTCAQTQSLLGLVPLPKHHRWCLGIELSMLVVGLGATGAGGW